MNNEKPDWIDPTIYTCRVCGARIDGSQGACKSCVIIVSVITGIVVIGVLINILYITVVG